MSHARQTWGPGNQQQWPSGGGGAQNGHGGSGGAQHGHGGGGGGYKANQGVVVPAPSNGNSHSGIQMQAPPITISSLSVGENVDVFHRYNQDPNGYFMVQQATQGMIHPSVGKTDGWTHAVVAEAWDVKNYNQTDFQTWPQIRWMHQKWYNRRGHRLDVSRADMTTQRVCPEQIRQKCSGPTEAQKRPALTLFHVRWGGEQAVNPVTEGQGGWGQIGSTPSDNYINAWENTIFSTMGPNYEIYSAFIQGSDELGKISPSLVRTLMTGQCVGALYFLWPIIYQDGHNYPAYVNSEALLSTMLQMEASGVPSRFPHHSHLYRVFASKEWTAQMCLHPLLNVPLTTKVSRQAITLDPDKASETALQALSHLARTRTEWAGPLCQETPAPTVTKGVAKLGWSWEAMDVRQWTNKQTLSNALVDLTEQPGSHMEFCFVQEWVDFDVEMRHFIVEADLNKPASLKAKKIIYTIFKSKDSGSFRDFDRYDRKGALKTCFQNDDAALADAEAQAEVLMERWLRWLSAQSHELPVVIRFDILAKRTGPGTAKVMTGELTELGGCFLGWPNGPSVVMGAMLRSCLKDPSNLSLY